MKIKIFVAIIVLISVFKAGDYFVSKINDKTELINRQVSKLKTEYEALNADLNLYRAFLKSARGYNVSFELRRLEDSLCTFERFFSGFSSAWLSNEGLLMYKNQSKKDVNTLAKPIRFMKTTKIGYMPVTVQMSLTDVAAPSASLVSLLNYLYRLRYFVVIDKIEVRGGIVNGRILVVGRKS